MDHGRLVRAPWGRVWCGVGVWRVFLGCVLLRGLGVRLRGRVCSCVGWVCFCVLPPLRTRVNPNLAEAATTGLRSSQGNSRPERAYAMTLLPELMP